jgi:predicted ArsR family transcriptional regulator
MFNFEVILMSKVSTKDKLLSYFFNPVYNTLTVAQAQARFGITNVSARINELRQEGFAIYTNTKTLEDGRTISYYRLGSPSARFTRNLNAGRTKLAIKSLSKRAA